MCNFLRECIHENKVKILLFHEDTHQSLFWSGACLSRLKDRTTMDHMKYSLPRCCHQLHPAYGKIQVLRVQFFCAYFYIYIYRNAIKKLVCVVLSHPLPTCHCMQMILYYHSKKSRWAGSFWTTVIHHVSDFSRMKFVLKTLSWSNKIAARWTYHLNYTTLHQNKFWKILQECVIFRSKKWGIQN